MAIERSNNGDDDNDEDEEEEEEVGKVDVESLVGDSLDEGAVSSLCFKVDFAKGSFAAVAVAVGLLVK